jgi:hypothetical protein
LLDEVLQQAEFVALVVGRETNREAMKTWLSCCELVVIRRYPKVYISRYIMIYLYIFIGCFDGCQHEPMVCCVIKFDVLPCSYGLPKVASHSSGRKEPEDEGTGAL